MSDTPKKSDDLAGVDPRLIEAAEMAVPMALDWAGKKLAEAFEHFKSRFEQETGGDFEAIEPEDTAIARNQAFIDRVPKDKKGFSDELRQRLVQGGARVDTIMADKATSWPGKGWDAVRVQDARQTLGMMTVDLSKASLHGADLRGANWADLDLSQALGSGHNTGVRVASDEEPTSRHPDATHRGPDLPDHGGYKP